MRLLSAVALLALPRLASYLITKEVVERCDHLIDLHGGDLDESLRPYAYWTPTGREEQDRVSRDMVLAFGLDHIIVSTDRPQDDSVLTVTSDEAGLFYPRVKRGEFVARGMAIGHVTDFFGRKVFEARAPAAGVVLYICSVPSMTKGGTIANVGVVRPGS